MMKSNRPLKWLARALAVGMLALGLMGAAWAQLGGLGLPGGGILQSLPGTIYQTTGNLDHTLHSTADTVRRDGVGRPLRTGALDRDPLGARIVRGEIIAVSPSQAALAIANKLNFTIVRHDTLSGLGMTMVVFTAPDGMTAADALAALKKADPAGSYDYDHLYDPSGASGHASAIMAVAAPNAAPIRIGMIDGGVDTRHPVFAESKIVTSNAAGSHDGPATAHGTAVASLLVGEDSDFHGYLPGATLYVADAFGGEATGGSADDIVRALDWLAVNRVAVANVSLAGPPNALLEAGVRAFLARGHVLVAAVGNEGPAAPRAYPAAYPGVIAVTSVDEDYHLEVDANRGAVTFAARGVDVRAAAPERRYKDFTGTSFAAPAVAARFALLVPTPDVQSARRACLVLEHAALPLGKGAGDPAFGYGYLNAPSIAVAAKK